MEGIWQPPELGTKPTQGGSQMSRHDLTDGEWDAIRVFLPAERTGKPGRCWTSHRQVINGILWVLAVGGGWRDVPAEFGKWQTVYNRFRRWRKEQLWDRIYHTVLGKIDRQDGVDRTLWCVDGSVIRAHRAAAGGPREDATNPDENALGRSQGGYSTKIHILTDRKGLVLAVTATPGQAHESKEFENLMTAGPLRLHRKAKRPQAIAGDKGYSSGKIRAWMQRREIEVVIPARRNEQRNPRFKKRLYKQRNIVERIIGRLKECRRIATRYDKIVDNYLAMIKIAAFRLNLKHL
jgi:transposase